MGCQHEIVVARLNGEIAHRHRGQLASLELRPVRAAIDRDPQPEFGAEKQQPRIDAVLLDDVGVTTHAL